MRKLLVLVLLLLIATKTAAILLAGPIPIQRDALGYWKLSVLVMQGDVLMFQAPIAYRTPVYPWFLATIRFLSGAHALQVLTAIQGLFFFGIAHHCSIHCSSDYQTAQSIRVNTDCFPAHRLELRF